MAGVCHEVNVRDGHRICTRAEHNRRVFRTNNAAVGTIKMESLALEHVLRKQSQDLNTDKPNGLPLTAALTTTTLTLLARPRHGIHPRPLTFESTVYYRLTYRGPNIMASVFFFVNLGTFLRSKPRSNYYSLSRQFDSRLRRL